MLKATTLLTLMLLLCSCEIFGWDSSGGATGEIPTNRSDEEYSQISNTYYIDVPISYPNSGSETPTETASGSQIIIPSLEEQPRTIVISEENALILTKAACDQTATDIVNINIQETETTVSWQNENLFIGSLSLSKDTSGDPPLQLITCIN